MTDADGKNGKGRRMCRSYESDGSDEDGFKTRPHRKVGIVQSMDTKMKLKLI